MEMLPGIVMVLPADMVEGVEPIAPFTSNLVCGVLVEIPTFWPTTIRWMAASAIRRFSFFIAKELCNPNVRKRLPQVQLLLEKHTQFALPVL